MSARLLVVDDMPANLLLLERLLTDEFFEVLQAASGAEALALARQESPDLVLLDVMMPEMDGYEVCRRLKADTVTQNIPVIMVTALDEPAARAAGMEAGADDFLVKPVRDIELFARVRSHLRLKLLFDELRARSITDELVGIDSINDEAPERPHVIMYSDGSGHAEATRLELERFAQVTTAEPASLRTVLAHERFDLAVVSLMASPADGLRLVTRLRTGPAGRDLPILALSDRTDLSPLAKGFEIGVSDCIKCPVDAVELRTRAGTLIKRRALAERLRTSARLSVRLAVTDAVTGVHNRHFLMRHLTTTVRRAYDHQRPASILMLDIDHFKQVNDDFGHAAGDRVLRAVAERITTSVRAVDLVARYGGEEFVVIMPDTAIADAHAIAERVRRAVSDLPFTEAGRSRHLTVSIGVAGLGDADVEGDDLLARADAALYLAKRAGRNRVESDGSRAAA